MILFAKEQLLKHTYDSNEPRVTVHDAGNHFKSKTQVFSPLGNDHCIPMSESSTGNNIIEEEADISKEIDGSSSNLTANCKNISFAKFQNTAVHINNMKLIKSIQKNRAKKVEVTELKNSLLTKRHMSNERGSLKKDKDVLHIILNKYCQRSNSVDLSLLAPQKDAEEEVLSTHRIETCRSQTSNSDTELQSKREVRGSKVFTFDAAFRDLKQEEKPYLSMPGEEEQGPIEQYYNTYYKIYNDQRAEILKQADTKHKAGHSPRQRKESKIDLRDKPWEWTAQQKERAVRMKTSGLSSVIRSEVVSKQQSIQMFTDLCIRDKGKDDVRLQQLLNLNDDEFMRRKKIEKELDTDDMGRELAKEDNFNVSTNVFIDYLFQHEGIKQVFPKDYPNSTLFSNTQHIGVINEYITKLTKVVSHKLSTLKKVDSNMYGSSVVEGKPTLLFEKYMNNKKQKVTGGEQTIKSLLVLDFTRRLNLISIMEEFVKGKLKRLKYNVEDDLITDEKERKLDYLSLQVVREELLKKVLNKLTNP